VVIPFLGVLVEVVDSFQEDLEEEVMNQYLLE